ncbi:MAG TPA: ATP-binding cassette domain-containing protein [Polyangiaceae bacterium]
MALLGLVAVGVKAAGGAWGAWEEARIGGDVGGALRLQALDGWLALHRLRAPRQSDQGAAPARALAALTHDVRELEAGLDAGVLAAVRAVFQIAPLLVLLVAMAPGLALAALAAFALFSVALGRARHGWKMANRRAALHRDALLDAADEAVKHAELWTTYGAEGRVREHLRAIGGALAKQSAQIAASAAALSGANEVLGALALVLAIAAARAGWLAGDGEKALLPFAVTFFLAYRPLRDLTEARLALVRASVAAEGLAPLFEAADRAPPEATPEASPRDWRAEPLRIDGLELAHGAAGPVSVLVPPGTLLAIVGETGSGKTTLLRTLLGLEAPRAGAVRYGQTALEAAPGGPRARPFAWVPQEAPLLADTLDANVALAPGSGDPREAMAALGAESLAASVGDARLGRAGRSLSGGERQWVALARAVATRLPVLLLDEPTSGLDAASQARVIEAIARLKGERTVILVTHREEPLAIADAVLRLGPAANVSGTPGLSSSRRSDRRPARGPRSSSPASLE